MLQLASSPLRPSAGALALTSTRQPFISGLVCGRYGSARGNRSTGGLRAHPRLSILRVGLKALEDDSIHAVDSLLRVAD